MTRRALAVFALAATGFAGCYDKPKPAVDEHILSFDTASVHLASRRDTVRLSLELARDSAHRTMGLMERRHLAENAGMLFLYDSTQGKDAAFWMYRTRIPLDIAFIDSTGVIRAVLGMAPCTAILIDGCPSYPPGVPYRYALEMNAGFFGRHGLGVGDELVVRELPTGRVR